MHPDHVWSGFTAKADDSLVDIILHLLNQIIGDDHNLLPRWLALGQQLCLYVLQDRAHGVRST